MVLAATFWAGRLCILWLMPIEGFRLKIIFVLGLGWVVRGKAVKLKVRCCESRNDERVCRAGTGGLPPFVVTTAKVGHYAKRVLWN